jgi:hypothetical protein
MISPASGQFDHRPDNQFGENIFMGTSDAYPPTAVVGASCGHYNYDPPGNMQGESPFATA